MRSLDPRLIPANMSAPPLNAEPPPDLAGRLLTQIAAGAIWANNSTWARNIDIPDTTDSGIYLFSRATCVAAMDMITDWRHGGLIEYTGHAGDAGLFRLEIRDRGRTLLAGLTENLVMD